MPDATGERAGQRPGVAVPDGHLHAHARAADDGAREQGEGGLVPGCLCIEW